MYNSVSVPAHFYMQLNVFKAKQLCFLHCYTGVINTTAKCCYHVSGNVVGLLTCRQEREKSIVPDHFTQSVNDQMIDHLKWKDTTPVTIIYTIVSYKNVLRSLSSKIYHSSNINGNLGRLSR